MYELIFQKLKNINERASCIMKEDVNNEDEKYIRVSKAHAIYEYGIKQLINDYKEFK